MPVTTTRPVAEVSARSGSPAGSPWDAIRERFLAALDPEQRAVVALVLRQPRRGGAGLRQWLGAIATDVAILPAAVPPEVVQAYLADPEAAPLHECAACGLAVPVRPCREFDDAGEPERVYFPVCPACGGPTGRYARLCRPTEH